MRRWWSRHAPTYVWYSQITLPLSPMPTSPRTAWVRPLYLYAISLIALVVFIVGAVGLVNITIRRVIFNLPTSFYEDPYEECSYMDISEYEMDECINRVTKRNEVKARYELAREVSWGLSAILVSFPIFYYHWRLSSVTVAEGRRKRTS